MTITLGQLNAALPSLQKLAQLDLPIKSAFRISRFLKQTENDVKALADIRTKILKEFGEPTDEPGQFKVLPDRIDDFKTELEKLQDEEIECDFQPISLEDLGNVALSAQDLLVIDFLFKDEK